MEKEIRQLGTVQCRAENPNELSRNIDGYALVFNSLSEDLGGFRGLKVDWNDGYGLVRCPNLTKQSVLNVINELYDFRANGDADTIRTLQLHPNSLALLTDEEKAIATAKVAYLNNKEIYKDTI